jgi:hypothetical protein
MSSLLQLSHDELFMVMTFCERVNDILSLASTCTALHDLITTVVHERKPLTLTEPWTLTKAASQFWGIDLSLFSAAEKLFPHLKQPGALEQISASIIVDDGVFDKKTVTIEDLLALFSISRGETIALPSVECNMREETEYQEDVTEFTIVSGHEVQQLNLKIRAKYHQLIALLCKTPYIESLTVDLKERFDVSLPSSFPQLDSTITFDNLITNYQVQTLPMFDHLRKIHVTSKQRSWTYDRLANLIMTSPVLEELTYKYDREPINDNLLFTLADYSVNLQKLTIQHKNIGDTFGRGNDITDEGITTLLESCPIRELTIFNTRDVRGEFFKTIGSVGKDLESLMIHRNRIDHQQTENMQIGGGVMENLRVFALHGGFSIRENDIFINSLITHAPNLRVLYVSQVDITSVQVVKLIDNYDLVELHIRSHELGRENLVQAIQKKKNLRKLHIVGDYALFTSSLLKDLEMPQVRYWYGAIDTSALPEFEKAFPNLTDINARYCGNSTFCTFIADPTHWPELSHYTPCSNGSGELLETVKKRNLIEEDRNKEGVFSS